MDLCGGQEISEKPSLLLAPHKGCGLCSRGLRDPQRPTEPPKIPSDKRSFCPLSFAHLDCDAQILERSMTTKGGERHRSWKPRATWRCYVVESNDRSLFLCICLSLSSAGSSALSACSSCGQRGATLVCGVWAAHCSGFSWCRTQALPGRARQLQFLGFVVVAIGLSCAEARGIFLDQGSNLCLLHWQAGSLPLSCWGNPHDFFFSDLF